MKKVTFIKVFDIYTYHIEEFDLDSFKEFMWNNYKVGLAHSLCLTLKFEDKSIEVFIYKLDSEYLEYQDKYIEDVYL